ncbi:MAG: IclR family transcriptional regulator [Bryobacteraceae bacterium]
MKERKGTLSSGVRCLQILRLLSGAEEDLALREIAEATGLHPSTAHRIVTTLVTEGFVQQQPDRRYRLSIEAFAVGAGYLRRSAIRRAATPLVMRLAEQTHSSVNLAFWHKGKVVVVDCIPMPGMYHFYTETGTIVPPHATGIGKAILAFRGKSALAEIGPLTRFTINTICTMPALVKEMERIHRDGYAIDNEENILGCKCVAAPVLQSGREAIAAISISAPPSMIPPERIPELAACVKEICFTISMQIGHRPVAFPAKS